MFVGPHRARLVDRLIEELRGAAALHIVGPRTTGKTTVVARSRPRLLHVRQQQGRLEVDVLVERGGGDVVGIEVKASAAPTASDARHLMALRDRVGAAFVAGVVLHTGPRAYRLGDRIVATPISSLWAAA